MARLQGLLAMGAMSRGWLITVEAPGHPGHPASTQFDAVVNFNESTVHHINY